MSDRMTPIPFYKLIDQILSEKKQGSVFGIRTLFVAKQNHTLSLFGEKMETPFGPAAGPHTQLAQNIIAAYAAGARFFELKTVQKLDGEDLPVSKPCIEAADEGYNVEWSTELTVEQAFEEYVKAWFAIKLMAKEFGIGAMDGFIFNMSVGYDLEGIRLKKIDDFIEGLKDASKTSIFRECKDFALNHLELFTDITAADVESISPHICTSATLSTLHGCPPQEIERIATYLMQEKHLHTFIKCNPTLLGYEYARRTLDDMGYDYVSFGEFHFKDDLQYADAVPMLKRLMSLADTEKLQFGVKITNTFPVDIKANELPGEEMYMSGRALYPLSIALAAKLSEEFDGGLRISYSGGADAHNIKKIFDTGIWPVTMATTLLKPGGYQRMTQIGEFFNGGKEGYPVYTGIDAEAVKALAKGARRDKNHKKSPKLSASRKMDKKVPLIDCFVAPCREGCPIHQDITAYMELVSRGEYAKALYVIMEKNPLPYITGTICAHRCMSKCTRNFYEEPVHIRKMKLRAARGGYDMVLKGHTPGTRDKGRVAIIGAGPAGISAAYFLARAGMDVTIFEKKEVPGGVVRHVIPEFRIASEEVMKDVAFIERLGVHIRVNEPVHSIEELKAQGYKKIIVAIGACKEGILPLKAGSAISAVTFLEDYKNTEGDMDIGRQVVVVGGGNTAMDTARAAIRVEGVEKVTLIYRRTKHYMPADEEELLLAIEEGVEFMELLTPVSFEDAVLTCHRIELGEPDASGRRSPIETEDVVQIPADVVIAAVGEHIDDDFYHTNNIMMTYGGNPAVDADTLQCSIQGVYIIGDGRGGPATVVEAIADATKASEAILTEKIARDVNEDKDLSDIYEKRGVICDSIDAAVNTTTTEQRAKAEYERCLSCFAVCEACVEVCPNRANVSIRLSGKEKAQILHIDKRCNECGNCKTFCPYDSAPYLDKFTLFDTAEDFEKSKNQGFVLINDASQTFKLRIADHIFTIEGFESDSGVDSQLINLVETAYREYRYLF